MRTMLALSSAPLHHVAAQQHAPAMAPAGWIGSGLSRAKMMDTPLPKKQTPLALGNLDERALLGALGSTLLSLFLAASFTRANPSFPIAREILAGGLAAAIGEAVFYPVEVAKVRLQAARRSPETVQSSLYTELLPILRGGIVSWAATPGVVAGVLRALIYHGLRLGLFPPIRRALAALLGGASVSLGAKMLIGATCGALGAALCNPFDLVKARMAASPDEYQNSLSALGTIAQQEGGTSSSAAKRGWAALWRGTPATSLRAALGSGAQLATYDASKRLIAQFVPGGYGLPVLLATCASAAAYVTAAAPADVVKTRLMVAGRGEGAVKYDGPIDCLKRSVREEGLMVLYRGWGASFARLLPVLLLVFPLLERLRLAFGVGVF